MTVRQGALCLTLLIFLLSGCADKQQGEVLSETRLLLDTFCTITIHGNVNMDMLDEAFELCAELEALFSITMEGSDIWRINFAGGGPVTVDPGTIELITAGLEFSGLSDGMFDITIGRLSRLWDFGSGESFVPSGFEIEEALKTVDFAQVHIDGNTVQLTMPHEQPHIDGGDNRYAWLDLGAIAKGYIGDRIAELLIKHGVSGALIDLGGDVVTIGSRPDGTPWRIAVKKPFGSMNEYLGVLEVTGVSVISSGTYERRFEIDGKNYHHILDPNTGMPAISDVISATVVTGSALSGEGLSTIAILLGSERASEIFEKAPGFIGAVLVLESGKVLRFGDVMFVTQGEGKREK